MNIIIDTGSPEDGDSILECLEKADLKPDDVDVVVNTHDHKDHTGENRLFTKARIICGYMGHEEKAGRIQVTPTGFFQPTRHRVELDSNVHVIHTPGHTRDSISVVIKNINSDFAGPTETIIAAGDAVPTEANFLKGVPPAISYNSNVSLQSMVMITDMADWVIPGHDKPFRVRG
jgi:glyoxylase-like metal-dependent hydrolase (beta-lactamase superfamily II)